MKVTINTEPAGLEKEESGEYEEYEIECAVRALIEAEEVKKDPKLFELAKAKMSEKMDAMKKITSIQGLKDKAKMMKD